MRKQLEADKLESLSKEIYNLADEMRSDKKTQLVGVKLVEENVICEKITEKSDIYDMLQASVHHPEKFDGYDLIAVLTAGWAAPNNNDEHQNTPPSEHPEIRRVKLAMVGYTAEQTASIVSFDDTKELIYSPGEGQGALQDAFEEMLNEIGW